MSGLPAPRHIRRNWRVLVLTAEQAATLLAQFRLRPSTSPIVEARAWRVIRGHQRGRWKRVDVRYEDGALMSVRFNARATVTRFGVGCCV